MDSPPLNYLTSFPYTTPAVISHMVRLPRDRLRWFLDSGAFTAYKAGKVIELDDYCRFLDAVPVRPWRYFMLDVIGDGPATRKNYEIMLKRGYHPVPVFTRGEDPRAIDDYFETSDLVGIGGVAFRHSQPYGYLKHLWPKIGNRHVHILGFSSIQWMKYFRPFSCDSSSWEQGGRYGQVPVYTSHGHFAKLTKDKAFAGLTPKVHDGIRRLGFDPMALQRRESWHGGFSVARWLGAASWVAMALDVERNLGTKFFLASACADHAPQMVIGSYLYLTDGTWGDYDPADLLLKRKKA